MGPLRAEITQEEKREQDALHAALLCVMWVWERGTSLRWNRLRREIELARACKTSCMWSAHAAYFPGLPVPTILYSSLSDPQLCVQHAPFHPSSLKRSFIVLYELYCYFPLLFFWLCFLIFFSFNLAFWLCPFLCHLHCFTFLIVSLQSPLPAEGKEHA